jgi:hypothetical protein
MPKPLKNVNPPKPINPKKRSSADIERSPAGANGANAQGCSFDATKPRNVACANDRRPATLSKADRKATDAGGSLRRTARTTRASGGNVERPTHRHIGQPLASPAPIGIARTVN